MVKLLRPRIQRSLVLALIACSLLARLLVPPGWMPVQTANGWQITICTGTGPMKMAMPAAMAAAMSAGHHQDKQPEHDSQDHPCAFAGLALALAPPITPPLLLPAQAATVSLLQRDSLAHIGQGLAAPPPPSTGPPLHA